VYRFTLVSVLFLSAWAASGCLLLSDTSFDASDTSFDASDMSVLCPSESTIVGEYALISAGTFTMGSPTSEPYRGSGEDQHTVTLTRDFYIGLYEVTQAQWQALMGNNPSTFSSCGSSCPVERVNWYEAVAYANALSQSEGFEACYTLSGCAGDPGEDMECSDNVGFSGLDCTGYRLPTEAEWEYAARACTTTAWYCGSNESCVADIAWYAGSTTQPVGQKNPNAWGLYDMSGNVWEWVWDWYDDFPSSATDPTGPSSGQYRVFRGGGWGSDASGVRSADRNYRAPGNRTYDLGFRLARSGS